MELCVIVVEVFVLVLIIGAENQPFEIHST